MEWRDEMMMWNNATYGGIRSINVPQHLLWILDVELANGVEPPEALGLVVEVFC